MAPSTCLRAAQLVSRPCKRATVRICGDHAGRRPRLLEIGPTGRADLNGGHSRCGNLLEKRSAISGDPGIGGVHLPPSAAGLSSGRIQV